MIPSLKIIPFSNNNFPFKTKGKFLASLLMATLLPRAKQRSEKKIDLFINSPVPLILERCLSTIGDLRFIY